MVLFAQILKFSADHNLAKNAVNLVETKLDKALMPQKNRPRVSSSQINLQEISDSDDFNFHDKIQDLKIAKSKKPSEQEVSIACSKFLTLMGSLFVGTLSLAAVVSSR